MRLYVTNYNISASNNVIPVREMGRLNPTGVMLSGTDYKIHCDFVPIADEGESTTEMLAKLQEWINGAEINMVSAVKDRPRCFYCGTMVEIGANKCKYCGGEVR